MKYIFLWTSSYISNFSLFSEEKCQDSISTRECKKDRDRGHCGISFIAWKCAKTCGYCKKNGELQISFGGKVFTEIICFDIVHRALNTTFSFCLGCTDSLPVVATTHKRCKRFKLSCSKMAFTYKCNKKLGAAIGKSRRARKCIRALDAKDAKDANKLVREFCKISCRFCNKLGKLGKSEKSLY